MIDEDKMIFASVVLYGIAILLFLGFWGLVAWALIKYIFS